MNEIERLDREAREWAEDGARTKRIALWMVVFLAVGTVVEYVLGTAIDRNLFIMVPLNVAEAGAILWFFMHVSRAWRGEEH